jgi:hypothetical protein
MLWACHSVAIMRSSSVAPCRCFSNSNARAFLLLSGVVAAFGQDLAFLPMRGFAAATVITAEADAR